MLMYAPRSFSKVGYFGVTELDLALTATPVRGCNLLPMGYFLVSLSNLIVSMLTGT